ncbi:unnamed protein product [Ceutorhynchus assimilis]|uniref:Uncharacterized protein n=1 Tax=Ceutorhynchus assimilis TaxID=467358 RepID=A0A9N9M9W0_9CUCU|nr:unnamed protein product [Ceutorhynchus assimilis]
MDLKSINESCAGWGRQVDEVSSDQVSKLMDHSRCILINIFEQKKNLTVDHSWNVEPAVGTYFTDQEKYPAVDHSWDVEPAVGTYIPDQVSKLVANSRCILINIFKQKKDPNVDHSWDLEPAVGSYFTDQRKNTVDHSWNEEPAVGSYNPEAYVLSNRIIRCAPPKMSKTAKKNKFREQE